MKKKKPQTASKNSKNPNSNPDISYQNKDIVSKLFGEQMKGKSLSLFGLDTNLKVMDIRPTNIPNCPGKRTSHGIISLNWKTEVSPFWIMKVNSKKPISPNMVTIL